jgi:hypothetical protein
MNPTYLIDHDDLYTPSPNEFANVYIDDRREKRVLFYMPRCIAFPFPTDVDPLIIQRAAVFAMIASFMPNDTNIISMAYNLISGIPENIIDMACAISGIGNKVYINQTDISRALKMNSDFVNHRRLEYLTLGPINLKTFADIVSDAYGGCLYMGLYMYSRTANHYRAVHERQGVYRRISLSSCVFAAQSYLGITTAIEYIGWCENWGDDAIVFPPYLVVKNEDLRGYLRK